MNIIQKISPNFIAGRGIYKPEIIVLHIMQGSLTGTDQWFMDKASQVSSHFGVGLNGEIHQYVCEADQAFTQGYHEGATFKLHKPGVNPNLYCLSIEHEGQDLSNAPLAQLQASAALIKDMAMRWNIPVDRAHIIGHYEVDPIRKPNCPAVDKTVIDKIVKMVADSVEPMVNIPCPQSKVEKIKKIIEII